MTAAVVCVSLAPRPRRPQPLHKQLKQRSPAPKHPSRLKPKQEVRERERERRRERERERERERKRERERERERERGYILSIPLTFFIFIFNFIFNFVFGFVFGFQKGCHLVTGTIEEQLSPLLKGVSCGMCNVFLQHTSASLTINENADPSVRVDMETFLNLVVPEGYSDIPWTHTMEGKDDMPAHCKSSMFGASLNIPVTNGRLALGTWQGIWLCEHRDHATPRSIVCTVTGA